MEGPLDAYIHLVDSFLALKVETFSDRFTFAIIHEYLDYSKTSARDGPGTWAGGTTHSNLSTLENIFIINNLLI